MAKERKSFLNGNLRPVLVICSILGIFMSIGASYASLKTRFETNLEMGIEVTASQHAFLQEGIDTNKEEVGKKVNEDRFEECMKTLHLEQKHMQEDVNELKVNQKSTNAKLDEVLRRLPPG